MTRVDTNKLANCKVIDLFEELSERDKSYNDRLVALVNELRKLNKEKAINISELAELSGISVEPCEDCISREAALEVIANNNITGEILLTRYDAIIEGLYELPSVQPESRWIPCSERLPEETGHYLVTLHRYGKIGFDLDETIIKIIRWNDMWMLPLHSPEWIEEAITQEVLAWMPLLEPYKAESEG